MKIKLQFAVVLIEDTTIVYNMLVITDKLYNITWFDTEDEAVFNFADRQIFYSYFYNSFD